MKLLSEQKALVRLREIKDELRTHITERFEHRAKSCQTCETPGACCLDAHFVNVRISRLEAVAIKQAVNGLTSVKRAAVLNRIEDAIEKYGLDTVAVNSEQKYACPLFEKGTGCLVHNAGKPIPCMMHACYENEADLPPIELQSERELQIEKLNKLAYGRSVPWMPIPLAIRKPQPKKTQHSD